MKKSELILIIVVLIFLGFIFIYFIYNIKNKQLQAIAIQKSKIQSEIQKLNANKTYIPKEFNNSNYENLLSFIRKYDLAKIEQVKSSNNNVNISFKLKGENFLKILDYIYKNEDFLKIDSFNVVNVVNDNLNELLVNLVILNLYKQPDVEDISYYPFNLKFFNEKEYIDMIKKEIEERKKKEELEKLILYSNAKEINNKNEVYNKIAEDSIKEDNLNESISLNMIYKGAVFINNEKYGVLAINDKEYFLKEGQDITIDKNNIRVLNINKQSVKLVINNSETIEIKLNVF
jgi:hypothetical protein